MRNLLFICSRNKIRSTTAEDTFETFPNINTRSAGTASDAATIASFDDIEWADVIYCMEQIHKEKLIRKFKDKLRGKKIKVLHIQDKYEFMDEELVRLLKERVKV